MRDEYDMRRQYVYSRLSAIPNISVVEPQGAFYFFVDTSRLGLTSLNLCDTASGTLQGRGRPRHRLRQ